VIGRARRKVLGDMTPQGPSREECFWLFVLYQHMVLRFLSACTFRILKKRAVARRGVELRILDFYYI
jgi:hypothetical protein